MELRQLRYFVAIAEELNFTRAAQRLYIAQPSLSQQIRQLEDELGVCLISRSRKNVALTEAGTVFLAEARLTLSQAERAARRAREMARQTLSLSIGFIPSAEVWVFPLVLPALRLRFPDLDIQLHSIPTPHLEAALRQHRIDVAFMRGPVGADLHSEVVLTEPLIAVLPAAHALSRLARIPADALNGEDFVSMNPEYAGPHICEVIDTWAKQNGLHCKPVQSVSNVLLGLNLASMGLGYTILPAYVERFASSAVCCRPLAGSPPTIDLLAVAHTGAHTVQLDALLELARHVGAQSGMQAGSNGMTAGMTVE